MPDRLQTKVLVVGGGPGGYVAAIRASQLGIDCVLVEADRLGGTCLIRGCIPSKALIHAGETYAEMSAAAQGPRMGISLASRPRLDWSQMRGWKDGIVDKLNSGVGALLQKAKVRVVCGWARFTDAKTCIVSSGGAETRITTEHVILATGSVSAGLSSLPFSDRVISSTEALALDSLPRRLAVVGGGYIGLELGTAFAKLGCEVSVVELRERILPQYDAKLTTPVSRWLEAHGVALHLGAKALGDDGRALMIETAIGERIKLAADKILVTVGRRPNTEGWGLEEMAVEMAGPFVKVDERCATSTTGVWAIGDLVGEPMLAHKASAQGEMVAEIIAGQRRKFDPVAVPAVCFTEPEIVSIGLAPDEAAEQGQCVVGQFPFQANARALTMGGGEGFVRAIARASDHRILGIQAVGRHVSELSGEFTALLEMGAVLEDVAGIIHAHPTLSEALQESALSAFGSAIHV